MTTATAETAATTASRESGSTPETSRRSVCCSG